MCVLLIPQSTQNSTYNNVKKIKFHNYNQVNNLFSLASSVPVEHIFHTVVFGSQAVKLLEILGVLGLEALFPSGYLPTTNGGKVKNSLKYYMKKKLFKIISSKKYEGLLNATMCVNELCGVRSGCIQNLFSGDVKRSPKSYTNN